MANNLLVKYRPLANGSAAPLPAALKQAELAYNETSKKLYIGAEGTEGGAAVAVHLIADDANNVKLSGAQTIADVKTFSSTIVGSVNGNAGTATALQTARDLSLTGDATATISAFNGTANGTAALTLATVNSNVGTFAGLTVNAKGLVTAAAQASLSAFSAPTADLAIGGFKLTGVAAPTVNTDAATKGYVDGLLTGGVTYKGVADASAASVNAATGNTVHANGDMYRVTTAGNTAFGFQLNVGDFAIYNGTTWNNIDATDPAVTGTTNRITVTATGDTSYAVDISATYVGQSSITTLGTVATGTWNASTIGVAYGGTGATTLTGYVKGSGTSALTASATIPNTDISGLGTMSTQNANAVNITGGTIDGVTLSGGTY